MNEDLKYGLKDDLLSILEQALIYVPEHPEIYEYSLRAQIMHWIYFLRKADGICLTE